MDNHDVGGDERYLRRDQDCPQIEENDLIPERETEARECEPAHRRDEALNEHDAARDDDGVQEDPWIDDMERIGIITPLDRVRNPLRRIGKTFDNGLSDVETIQRKGDEVDQRGRNQDHKKERADHRVARHTAEHQ